MAECEVKLATASLSKQEEHDVDACCWICHEGSSVGAPLLSPCRCACMRAHKRCLARWQLQNAGKGEERNCRFCKAQLPDWREAFAGLPIATPIMTVCHAGRTHQVAVTPGEEGMRHFQATIRSIFGLQESDDVSLSFGCKVPGAQSEITLDGWQAFDAAAFCAAVSAGQRLRGQQQRNESQLTTVPRTTTKSNSPGGTAGVFHGGLRRLFSRGHGSGSS